MWCGIGSKTVSIATICIVTASVVVSDVGFTAPTRRNNYTPQQFRSVLRGLGYKVKVTNSPLKDKETIDAIKEFQTGYRLKPVDGVMGAKTQDFAARIMQIMQSNLNLLVKPKPRLPGDQYYGPQTEAAVKLFQKKFKLEETGIADLAVRQKIDAEARKLLNKKPETEEVTPAPKPSPSPTTKPRSRTRPKPGATPKPTPTPTESPTPEESPSPSPSPESTPSPSPESTPESTPETTPSPEATPSPSPTGTPKPTPTPRR